MLSMKDSARGAVMHDLRVLGVLENARDLISDSSRWCQGVSARTQDGFAVEPGHAEACRWCSIGAIVRACAKNTDMVQPCIDALCTNLPPRLIQPLAFYNDTRDHDFILALFDKTIQKLRPEVLP